MPFLAPGELAACGLPDDGITIANPLVAEQSVLRTALLPGLLGAVAYNWSHRNQRRPPLRDRPHVQPSDVARRRASRRAGVPRRRARGL